MEGPKRNFIAEVVEAAMTSKKITNMQLAAEIGISQVTLDALRFGQHSVRMNVLMKLADYFQWTEVEVGSAVWYADILDKPPPRKPGRKKKQEGT